MGKWRTGRISKTDGRHRFAVKDTRGARQQRTRNFDPDADRAFDADWSRRYRLGDARDSREFLEPGYNSSQYV